MFNTKSVTRLFSLFFLGLVFAVAASCSGGETGTSNTTTSTTSTGSVALLLTDAPSDIFEEINITVTRAELLSDSGQVTLYDGSLTPEGSRTFNLLNLTDAKIFSIRDGIPAGTYNKIRLTLSKIELVDYKDTDDTTDDAYYYPKLPGNGKLDLKSHRSFDVVAGGTLTIQLDMDANKSIHIVKKGNKDEYNFRPVVFIDIVTSSFVERFVQLHGDITALDSTDQSFKLCNTDIPVQMDNDKMDDSSNGCVRVTTDTATAIFNASGMPTIFSDLVEGEQATVFGHLQHDSSVDDNHDNEQNGDVDDDRELHDLVLKAALIELGDTSAFQKLNGTAASAVDSNNQFIMDVAPGQGYITPLSLSVQIQNGTILINRKGVPVASSAIDTGKLVSVRGVLDVDNKTLLASLVVVDTDSSVQLTGSVGLNPDNSCGFSLITAGGDRSIATDSNTRAFMVVGGSSSPISVSDLVADQSADVYGNENTVTGCFDAHTIIAY